MVIFDEEDAKKLGLRVWHFDPDTLYNAWLEYHDRPVLLRHERFGQWFLNNFYIQGMVSWPALYYEENNDKALQLLSTLITTYGKNEE